MNFQLLVPVNGVYVNVNHVLFAQSVPNGLKITLINGNSFIASDPKEITLLRKYLVFASE